MKCINCNNELIGKQRQFCGDTCRMSYNRKANKPEQNNPNKSEQIQSEQPRANKTPNGLILGAIIPSLREDKETREVGRCSFCGEDIKQEGENWDLIECCYPCALCLNKSTTANTKK